MFITLLLVMTAQGGESSLTPKDIDRMIENKWNENKLTPQN
jgi:hypothetical protein